MNGPIPSRRTAASAGIETLVAASRCRSPHVVSTLKTIQDIRWRKGIKFGAFVRKSVVFKARTAQSSINLESCRIRMSLTRSTNWYNMLCTQLPNTCHSIAYCRKPSLHVYLYISTCRGTFMVAVSRTPGKTKVTADRDKIEFRLFNSSSIFNITLREELFSLPKKNQPCCLVLVSWC